MKLSPNSTKWLNQGLILLFSLRVCPPASRVPGVALQGHCRRCWLQNNNIVIISNRIKWAKLLVGKIWDHFIKKSQKVVRLWNSRLSSEQSQMTGTPPWHKTPPASPTSGVGAKLPGHPAAPPVSTSLHFPPALAPDPSVPEAPF